MKEKLTKENFKEFLNYLFPTIKAYLNFWMMLMFVVLLVILSNSYTYAEEEGITNETLAIFIVAFMAIYFWNEWISEGKLASPFAKKTKKKGDKKK